MSEREPFQKDLEVEIHDAKKIAEFEFSSQPIEFSGLSREELLRYGSHSKWVKVRWILFTAFWVVWLGLMITALTFLLLTPKCAPRPDLNWWNRGLVYQIDVDRFRDSNGDGIGDFNGIREKIFYLKELRVNSVILSKALNEKNPKEVNSESGDLASFNALVRDIHSEGMKVILDLPLSFLASNSSDILRYWFLLHEIDGVCINGEKPLNPEARNNHKLGEWNQVALDISKSTLKKRLILLDEFLFNITVINSNVNVVLNKSFLNEIMRIPELPPINEKEQQVSDFYEKTSLNQMLITDFDTRDFRITNLIRDKVLPFAQTLMLLLPKGFPVLRYSDEFGARKQASLSNLSSALPHYMQWDISNACGFTSNKSLDEPLKHQDKCKNSYKWMSAYGKIAENFELVKELIAFVTEPAFQWGGLRTNCTDDSGVFSFIREAAGFPRYIVAFHSAVTMKEDFTDFKELYGVPEKAIIKLFYSVNKRVDHDFKLGSEISLDRIATVIGDILVLESPPA